MQEKKEKHSTYCTVYTAGDSGADYSTDLRHWCEAWGRRLFHKHCRADVVCLLLLLYVPLKCDQIGDNITASEKLYIINSAWANVPLRRWNLIELFPETQHPDASPSHIKFGPCWYDLIWLWCGARWLVLKTHFFPEEKQLPARYYFGKSRLVLLCYSLGSLHLQNRGYAMENTMCVWWQQYHIVVNVLIWSTRQLAPSRISGQIHPTRIRRHVRFQSELGTSTHLYLGVTQF